MVLSLETESTPAIYRLEGGVRLIHIKLAVVVRLQRIAVMSNIGIIGAAPSAPPWPAW